MVSFGPAPTGLELIANGLAWHNKAYAKEQAVLDRDQYDAVERRAREKKRRTMERCLSCPAVGVVKTIVGRTTLVNESRAHHGTNFTPTLIYSCT